MVLVRSPIFANILLTLDIVLNGDSKMFAKIGYLKSAIIFSEKKSTFNERKF